MKRIYLEWKEICEQVLGPEEITRLKLESPKKIVKSLNIIYKGD